MQIKGDENISVTNLSQHSWNCCSFLVNLPGMQQVIHKQNQVHFCTNERKEPGWLESRRLAGLHSQDTLTKQKSLATEIKCSAFQLKCCSCIVAYILCMFIVGRVTWRIEDNFRTLSSYCGNSGAVVMAGGALKHRSISLPPLPKFLYQIHL